MKKIIATILCLTITTPCFAYGRYHHHYPNRHYYHSHYECRSNHCRYIHRCNHRCAHIHRSRTKTLAAVAGIAGIATVISAIVD